jgi:hypothetical protein
VLRKLASRSELLRDRLQYEPGIAQGRQADPEHAGPERRHELRRRFDAQPGLARPAGPRQRHNARAVAHERQDVADLSLSPHEARRRPRQIRVRDRLQRRKRSLPELEDRDRLGEVLQAVLAEILHGVVHVLLGCPREQHLAAVAGAHHARGLVDVRPHVLRWIRYRFARVDPDSDPDGAGFQTAHRFRHRVHGGLRRGERVEERVSLVVDLVPLEQGERLPHDPPMLSQRIPIQVRT